MNVNLIRPAAAALCAIGLAAGLACGGDDSDEEQLQTAEATAPTAPGSSPTGTSASPSASASASASPSAQPGTTPAAGPTSEAAKLDACEFVTKEEAEALAGVTFNEGSPITQQQGESGEVTIALCTYVGSESSTNALLVYLRLGGDRDEMLEQYDTVAAQAPDREDLDDVGEQAFWWAKEAQLNAVQEDTWLVLKLAPTPEGSDPPAGMVELAQKVFGRLDER
jgi:hypothetical protein